jgi:hypothetical protein
MTPGNQETGAAAFGSGGARFHFSGTGFSLWALGLGRANTQRPNPVPQFYFPLKITPNSLEMRLFRLVQCFIWVRLTIILLDSERFRNQNFVHHK